MIPYCIHVSVIIAVCFIFYKIFLQKETFFQLNRWVLLAFIAVSFALPFVPVPSNLSLRDAVVKAMKPVISRPAIDVKSNAHAVIENNSSNTTKTSPAIVEQKSEPIPWTKWIYYLYISGVIIFGANLLFQLIVLLIQCFTRPYVQDGPFRIIETSGDKAPCSFGNFIFINPEKYDWETYNQILQHEKIHCSQKHSLDILLAEIVLVFQWFNPFAWLYRKQVETNLEYLTDDSMVNNRGIERSGYQLNLLKVAAPHLPLGITTNYNQSLLKKRIAMMNEKKSSMQTAWKYFFLLPLLTFIVCALNQPRLLAQETSKTTVTEKESDHDSDYDGNMEMEGNWFATIKKDHIQFDFKSGKDGHNWSNNSSFPKSDFPNLPTQEKGDFKLTRDAGTINFNGKFDGDMGYGRYKFVPAESFKSYAEQQGIKNIKDQDMFAFFMVNVTKDYIGVLQKYGYKDISKDNVIAMAALGVDERYIRFWKSLGYDNLNPENLISSKALGIDSAYVRDIKDAGFSELDMDHLTSFKAQGINGDYVRKVRKAKSDKGETAPTADDIVTFKAMNIDEAYVKSISDAGYGNVPNDELVAMKSLGIDGAFIKSFQAIGYKDLSPDNIISFKSLGITSEFIKGFQSIGYKDFSPDAIISFKSLGITADFIKGFEAVGFKNMDDDKITSLKSLNIKPDFIKGFKDLGFKNITLDEVSSVKAMGITPEYVASMRKKGFNSNDINKYIELKSSFRDVQ